MAGSTSSLAASTKSQGRDEDNTQHKQKHKNLTDRLVFYPSSNNITDYNSSMNLNYMGYGGRDGPEPHQSGQSRQQYYVRQASPSKQQQHHQQQQQQYDQMRNEDGGDVGRTYMRSSSAPSRPIYYNEYGEPCEPPNRYISNQSGYVSISSQPGQHFVDMPYPSGQAHAAHHDKRDADLAGNHKYLNKFSQWLPDQLKLKRMSKRYRSHSLPAVADSDDDLMLQQQQQHQQLHATSSKGSGKGMPTAYHQDKRQFGKSAAKSMFTSPIKSGKSFLQRKSLSLSTPLARDDSTNSKKKKRSIASTMSNIMQKAKVYRRHSFSHSTLSNEYGAKGGPDPTAYRSQMGQQSMQGPSSKFMITKPAAQSYSQSDPESVHSDFFSDNEDRSASDFNDTGDRLNDKDLSNVAKLFATMEQSSAYQRQEQHQAQPKDSEQGTTKWPWLTTISIKWYARSIQSESRFLNVCVVPIFS